MIKAKRIGHATFTTPDIEKQIDYYRNVVGLHVVDREPKRAFLGTNSGQLAVVLKHGTHETCERISFEVSPSVGSAEMSKHLAAFGLKAETRTDSIPGLSQILTFQDLKGTTIELFSEPGFVNKGAQVGGAVALKLGHLAFVVEDPKATAEFYENVLGFRTSDWIGDYFVFLRCGPDHHTVNFIRGSTVKMHHIAFEMRDTAHLHNALGSTRAKGDGRHLGSGAPRPRPQRRRLSFQSGWSNGRVLRRARPDVQRRERLFRSSAVASRSAATAQSLGSEAATGYVGR